MIPLHFWVTGREELHPGPCSEQVQGLIRAALRLSVALGCRVPKFQLVILAYSPAFEASAFQGVTREWTPLTMGASPDTTRRETASILAPGAILGVLNTHHSGTA